jgi:hypothetical protein
MRTSKRKHVGHTEARLSKLIAGLVELPPGTRLGDRRTTTELKEEAEQRLTRYDAVHRARVAYEERIQERDQLEPATMAFLDEATDLLVGKLGRRSRQLTLFGVKPRGERAALTGHEIVAKTEKARLTRDLRQSRCSENECRRHGEIKGNGDSLAPVAAPVNGGGRV